MVDKHIFSESYEIRKQAVFEALRREDALRERSRAHSLSRVTVRLLVTAVVLSILTLSVYAAVQWIQFRMEQNDDGVHVYANLPDVGDGTNAREEKPLRSWCAEDGEISVCVRIPDLPMDMEEDKTANGKYGSDDNARSITVNGIDLRRSDFDQLIGGATSMEQFTAGGKPVYVVRKGEADYYNRIAFVAFQEEELLLKLWVSYGVTEEELAALVSTMTLSYTEDPLLAIPILNEWSEGEVGEVPFVIVGEEDPVYESDLIAIGESARDENNWFTMTVEEVSIHDSVGVLKRSGILDDAYIERFTDEAGRLIPYNRTRIVWIESEGKQPQKAFREGETVTKKLYVVTLTMTDVTMEEFSEEDRDRMLRACVNSFKLSGYTVDHETIRLIDGNAVVDRKPGEHAGKDELVYREYLENGRWRVAYLVDDDVAEGSLVLNSETGGIYVKIQ